MAEDVACRYAKHWIFGHVQVGTANTAPAHANHDFVAAGLRVRHGFDL